MYLEQTRTQTHLLLHRVRDRLALQVHRRVPALADRARALRRRVARPPESSAPEQGRSAARGGASHHYGARQERGDWAHAFPEC